MTGELYINGKDAFTNWGISLSQGAYAALISPPPAKSYLTTELRTADGKMYDVTNSRFDERTIALKVSIFGSNYDDMMYNLTAFANEVLRGGSINIKTKWSGNAVFHCVYKSCAQLSQANGRLGNFQITMVEPDPTNRV